MMEPRPRPQGLELVLMTLALGLATFMNILDTSIANVAIPAIAGSLGVSPNQGTWVITSFAVSTAIAVPLTGWLGKQFGEVRTFLICTFLFIITSWLCGLSNSLSMLIAFRVLQGAVAGPMIPLSQSLLLANYPDDKKNLATAFWAMVVVVAPIFGPILGGWITDNYSWPWIFYINIPIGILALFISWQTLRGRETALIKSRVDIIGLILLIIWVGSLQVMLDKGTDLDWFDSPFIITLATISAIAFLFFLIWELTDSAPIVDLSLFLNLNFTIGTIALAMAYFLYFGSIVIFPLWLQTQMSYTPTWAGLAAAPVGILSLILSPIVGRVANKIDLRALASFSFIIFALVSFWRSTFNTNVSFGQLAMPIFIQGIAVAFFFIPLIGIIISKVPANRIANAAGLSNFARILAGSFGTSLTVNFWQRHEAMHQTRITENVTNFSTQSTQYLNQLHQLGFSHTGALTQLATMVTQQAYMMSTNDYFWILGCIYLILTGLVWFTRPPFMAQGAESSGAH